MRTRTRRALRPVGSLKFANQGGNKALVTPAHAVDIALRVKRIH